MANEGLVARATLVSAGERVADFVLPDQNRKDWRLSEAAAKGDVLLAFYPFAFTGVCGTEMACVTDNLRALEGKGAQVVGISTDSPAANKAWAEKEGYKHTLLSDMHRVVVRAFGLHWAELNVSKRGTVIIGKSSDASGLVVKWSEGREPGQAMVWESVVGRL